MMFLLRYIVPYRLHALGLLILLGTGVDSALARQEARSKVVVEAESFEEAIVNGITTNLLLKATLTQDDTTVIADRLVEEGSDTEQYLLTGNVRIFERGDTVDADVVRYDGTTGVGRASGNVVMTDGESTMTAPSAVYYSEEKRAEFNEGVEYADSLSVLTSERGTYWSDETIADFKGNVRLRQEDLYMEADSIHYSREQEEMRAFGRVVVDRFESDSDLTAADSIAVDSTAVDPAIVDSIAVDSAAVDSSVVDPASMIPENRTRDHWYGYDGALTGFADAKDRSLMFSDVVFYDGSIDSSRVSGDVFLMRTQTQESGTDSLMIQAESMILTQTEYRDRVIAAGSVVVLDPDFSVVGDSLIYDRMKTGEIEAMTSRVFGRPRAWVNESQITSDSLHIFGTDGAIDSLHAVSNLFVASRDTSLDRIQQIKGRRMTAFFRDDSLRTMTVRPNAEVLFYFEPNAGEPVSAVQSSGDQFTFLFQKGEMDQLLGLRGIEGLIYRNNILDQVEDLAGYDWEPELRPDGKVMRSELLRREGTRAERHSVRVSGLRGESGIQ